jgi:DNA-binding response OmpR family regulator
MRVIIVEDDPSLGALLARVLGEERCQITLCTTATAGLRHASETYDVILLDWMLPDGDGPSFCVSARLANILTPILMLTARGEVHDRVSGLRSGADDYLVKPFEVEELLARLEALVRRSAQIARLVFGDLVIDRVHRHCTLQGAVLDLTVREYELLVRLAAANGDAVSRADLLRDVWRMSFDPGSGVLDVQISRLRDKLGQDASRIETVRGVGYRLRTDP